MSQYVDKNSRLLWVDIAKGIAILLVVVGHTVKLGFHGAMMRGLIFSFHMPLFFILSGLTLRYSDNMATYRDKLFKLFRKLIIPVFFVWAVLLVYSILMDHSLAGKMIFWKNNIYALIVGSGVPEQVMGFEVPALGKPWFLYALFFARNIYDYIHLKVRDSKLLLWCLGLSLLGVLFGQELRMTFSMDLALAVLPFLYFGHRISKDALFQNKKSYLLLALAVWLTTLFLQFPSHKINTYMELAQRRYPLFPLCFVTAIAGSMVVIELSIYLSSVSLISRTLGFIGRYSMTFFMVHCLDSIWNSYWLIEGHQMISTLYRLSIDLMVFLYFMLCKKLLTTSHSNKIQVLKR